jgi:signal transduction histidine kinase
MRLERFIVRNRERLLDVATKRLVREFPNLPTRQLAGRLDAILDQLLRALRKQTAEGPVVGELVEGVASPIGEDALRDHLPIGIVARQIGSLSDGIGTLAEEDGITFEASDYHILNLAVDNAVAAAVDTYYERSRAAMCGEGVLREAFFAHELRNAIASATLAFQVLRAGHVGVQSRTGNIIERNLGRMTELLDRALFTLRSQAQAQTVPQPTLLDVSALVWDVVADIGGGPHHVPVDVEVDEDLELRGDRTALGSALDNLIRNAVKYTRPGTRVTVRARRRSDEIVLEVEDACGGLPEGAAERLFAPFERGHRGIGTGLGLSIVREAAAAHGGRVWVEDRPGFGCCFFLALPVG